MARRRHRAGAWLEAPNPSARTGWRLCWTDPETKRVRKMTLDPARYPNEAARAKALESRSLTARTAHLDKREGVISMPVRDALTRYLAERRRLLRARTLEDYERMGEIFVRWCETNTITFARELTRAHLAQFRTERVTLPSERDSKQLRAPNTVNIELRAVHTMLKTWRRYEWLAVDRDTISDSLRQEPVHSEEITFLKPVQCRALLKAAMLHDREIFALTRREKDKGLEPSTPRHAPIAPFAAVVMLTGMRLGEALGLTWADVSLDDKTISLRATATKTKRTRRFEMSPGLYLLINGLWLEWMDRPKRRPTDRVFDALTLDMVEATRKRLAKREKGRDVMDELLAHASEANVGPWSWQVLRRTAATVLANMPSVGPWIESKMLGHSVVVAERLYSGRLKLPATATTIEAALGVQKELIAITRGVSKSQAT